MSTTYTNLCLSDNEQRAVVEILSMSFEPLIGRVFKMPLIGEAIVGDTKYSTVVDETHTTIRSPYWTITCPSLSDPSMGKISLSFHESVLIGDRAQLKHELTIAAMFLDY